MLQGSPKGFLGRCRDCEKCDLSHTVQLSYFARASREAANDLARLRIFMEVIVQKLLQLRLFEIGGKYQIRIRRTQPAALPIRGPSAVGLLNFDLESTVDVEDHRAHAGHVIAYRAPADKSGRLALTRSALRRPGLHSSSCPRIRRNRCSL